MRLKYVHTTLLLPILLAIVWLASCDRNVHEDEFPLPEGTGGLVVGLQTEGDLPAQDVHFFVFNIAGELAHHEYFDDPRTAALHVTSLPPSSYTAVAVLNVGADFMPPSSRAESSLPSITLPEFVKWLKTISSQYPDLLTGIGNVKVERGEAARITLTLQSGTEGIRLSTLRLRLTLPEPQLSDYQPAIKSRATEAGYRLRCVAELYRTGTENIILHLPMSPVLQADGTYLVELEADAGTYDLRLWTDYARTDAPQSDTYYDTKNLNAVKITTEPYYTANTDAKDAAYYTQTGITLPPEGTDIHIPLQRPLAKYRIIADDVEEYGKLTEENPAKYPPVEELTVTVQYDGFFPSTFSVASGKPTNALTGISFEGTPRRDATEEIQLASDWIIVNGTDSFVKVAIRISDNAGNTISRTAGIRIDYRRGYLTTVHGKFLTAGIATGGVQIDTEWEDTYIVEF